MTSEEWLVTHYTRLTWYESIKELWVNTKITCLASWLFYNLQYPLINSLLRDLILNDERTNKETVNFLFLSTKSIWFTLPEGVLKNHFYTKKNSSIFMELFKSLFCNRLYPRLLNNSILSSVGSYLRIIKGRYHLSIFYRYLHYQPLFLGLLHLFFWTWELFL